jgi:cellulose biosynthesis protein BcsQ
MNTTELQSQDISKSPIELLNTEDKDISGTVAELFTYNDTDFNLVTIKEDEGNSFEKQPENKISLPELQELFPATTAQGLAHIIKNIIGLKTTKHGRTSYLDSSSCRKLLSERGYKYKEKAEVIVNVATKGGIGKTITTVSFAKRANQYGARVLVIDADQQGNSTQTFGIDGSNYHCLYEVISHEQDCVDVTLSNAIIEITDTLHILPSNTSNSLLESYISMHVKRQDRLFANLLEPLLDSYDYIVFDCSPSLGTLNSSILAGADRLLIPLTPDSYSYKSIGVTLKWMRDVTQAFECNRDKKNKYFY